MIMKYISVVKLYSLFIVFFGISSILEIPKCNAVTKPIKSYPVLKIQIVEKNKKPVKINAKILHLPIPEENPIKKNTLRRRFQIPSQQFLTSQRIHDKSFKPLQSSIGDSKFSTSVINPISTSLQNPFIYSSQIPQNYFSTPGHIHDSDFVKGSLSQVQIFNTNDSNVKKSSIVTKLPSDNQSQLKEHFKDREQNNYNDNNLKENSKFMKKNKKYMKKFITNAPYDVYTYGLEKPHPLNEIHSNYHTDNENNDNTNVNIEEAEKLLKFMSSHEYFLPKYEPNYKLFNNHDELLMKNSKSGIFLEEPRPTLSYLPVFLQEQATAQKLIQEKPSYPVKLKSLTYQTDRFELKKPNSKLYQYEYEFPPLMNKTNLRDYHHHHNHHRRHHYHHFPYNNHQSIIPLYHNRPEPERIEFTEKDAITPNQKIDFELNTELPPSSFITPFRLIVEDIETVVTTPSTSMITKTTVANNSSEIKKINVFKNLPNHKTDDIDKEIRAYCNKQCNRNNSNNDNNSSVEEIQPVCGTDSITYYTEDHLKCMTRCQRSDITINYRGPCKTDHR